MIKAHNWIPSALFCAGLGAATAAMTPERAASSGPGHPWQASLAGVNLFSLARHVEVPLTTWRMRGGLEMNVALHHNSQAAGSWPGLGSNWAISILPYIEQEPLLRTGVTKITLYSGDHRVKIYACPSNCWEAQRMDGYADRLVPTVWGWRWIEHGTLAGYEFEPSPIPGRFHLSRIVDRNGNMVRYSYDPKSGRVTGVTDPSGRVLNFGYDGSGILKRLDLSASTTNWTWVLSHTNGQFSTLDTPPGAYYKFSYHRDRTIQSFTDPAGDQTSYSFDGRGIIIRRSGNSVREAYRLYLVDSTAAYQTQVFGPAGVPTMFKFDRASRLIEVAPAAPGVAPELRSYSDPDYFFAPSQISKGTRVVAADYDNSGNLLAATDARGNRTTFQYNAQNQVTRILGPRITDAWGVSQPARVTSFEYDARGNLIRVETGSPTPEVTTVSYDPAGELATMTKPGGRTTIFRHDSHGNLTQVISPAGRTRSWEYPAPPYFRPSAATDGTGQRTEYTYDPLQQRIVRIRTPEGITEYSYDAMNRLIRTVDESGQTDWAYSPGSRTVTETKGIRQLKRIYLANGLLSALEWNGSRLQSFTYDARNRLQSVTAANGTTRFEYDAEDRLVRRILGNGAQTSYGWTGDLVASIRHFDGRGTSIASFEQEYQEDGSLRKVLEGGLAGKSEVRYGHDSLNRLVREQRAGLFDFAWTFNAAGDRVQQVHNRVVTAYSHDPDGLVTQMSSPAGMEKYLWNANGQLEVLSRSGGSLLHHWDSQGRLARIVNSRDGTVLFSSVYDGLGRGVQQVMDGTSNTVSFSGRYALIEEQAGRTLAQYTWAGELISAYDPAAGRSMWPLLDATGLIREWLDDKGQRIEFSAIRNGYGQSIVTAGPHLPYVYGTAGGVRELRKLDLLAAIRDPRSTGSSQPDPLSWLKHLDRQITSPMELLGPPYRFRLHESTGARSYSSEFYRPLIGIVLDSPRTLALTNGFRVQIQ